MTDEKKVFDHGRYAREQKVTLVVPKDLKIALKNYAASQNRSMSYVGARILDVGLRKLTGA